MSAFEFFNLTVFHLHHFFIGFRDAGDLALIGFARADALLFILADDITQLIEHIGLEFIVAGLEILIGNIHALTKVTRIIGALFFSITARIKVGPAPWS